MAHEFWFHLHHSITMAATPSYQQVGGSIELYKARLITKVFHHVARIKDGRPLVRLSNQLPSGKYYHLPAQRGGLTFNLMLEMHSVMIL